MLKLIIPTIEYKQQIEDYKSKTLAIENHIHGAGSLDTANFEEWLVNGENERNGVNLPKGYCKATQFICVRTEDNKVVGLLQIRHELNDYLANFGGHIGDSIHPNERGKGYGTQMLKLGLEKSKEIGLTKVLLTCRVENKASKRCVIKNGGVYEDTRTTPDGSATFDRYWIEIK